MTPRIKRPSERRMLSLTVRASKQTNRHFMTVTLGGDDVRHLRQTGFDQAGRLFFADPVGEMVQRRPVCRAGPSSARRMDHPFVIEQSRELRDLVADLAHRLAWFVSPTDEPHRIDLLPLIQLLLRMGDFTTIDASPLDGNGPNL